MNLNSTSYAAMVRKFAAMQKRPFTAQQCADETGVNIRTVRARLSEMMNAGTIRRVNGGRTASYIATRPEVVSRSREATGENRVRNENCLRVWHALKAGDRTSGQISKSTGLSRQTVSKYLRAFLALGHITGETYYEIGAQNPPSLDVLGSYPVLDEILGEAR